MKPNDPEFVRLVSEAACDILVGRQGPPPHIEVASDREAMKMALQEYIVRLMFEGGDWGSRLSMLYAAAVKGARAEFNAAAINKGEVPF